MRVDYAPVVMRLLIAIGVTAATIACAASRAPRPPVRTAAGVRFTLVQPDARTVAVAGTFNHWSASSLPLTRSSRGLWSVVVPLPPGDHLFMFVVDGTLWVSPPAADDFADDGFGARNGIVVVGPDGR